MNDLEMELQTIRQKLQTLKSSPPEQIAAPWGQSRQTTASPNLLQVQTAIDTLRQRSEQPHSLAVRQPTVQEFDDVLTSIEQLAQKQRAAFQRLQTVGHTLIKQVQPGASSDIDEIARFLEECPAIDIPSVERTVNGYLDIDYRHFNFRQAEQDATSNAATLRSRSRLFQQPLSSDTELGITNNYDAVEERFYSDNSASNLWGDINNFASVATREVQNWFSKQFSPKHQRKNHSRFTLLDSAIWCVGAIIARIILNQIFQIYPALWTPVALLLILGVSLSLYSAIFSARPKPILGYRTLMIILGLLIGGRFST